MYECLSKWIRPGYTSPTIIVESGFIQHILSIVYLSKQRRIFRIVSPPSIINQLIVWCLLLMCIYWDECWLCSLSRCQGYQSVIQSVADKVIQDYQHVDQLEEESAHLLVEIGKSLLNSENPFTDIYSNFYTVWKIEWEMMIVEAITTLLLSRWAIQTYSNWFCWKIVLSSEWTQYWF